MSLLIHNIGILAGILDEGISRVTGFNMGNTGIIDKAWLLVDGERIKAFGVDGAEPDADEYFDAQGGALLPSFCDSHTHIVYAGSREQEFEDKIKGLSYEEIAKRGGGILNSCDRLRSISEEELFQESMKRINEIISKGTGAVEIKSGYGLSTDAELKMLRVIRKIKETSPIEVKSTFLGAHAVGKEYKGRQREYVDLICEEMVPAVAEEGLANYIDVFCDRGFFTPQETERILKVGAKYGLIPKIHADELDCSGGTEVGIRNNALSVDHLERAGENEINILKDSATIPTLLPGASFFLSMPFAPARKMVDAGLGIALASDYNPGSSPSGDMKFIMSLACLKMKLSPIEALNGTTINGAYAMGISNKFGSITLGKKANFFITEPIPSLSFLPYAYTSSLIKYLFLNGRNIN